MWSLSSSTTFVWNIFHCNKKWARYELTSSRSLRVIVKLYNSFFKLSHKRHVLRKNVIENKMCVLIFSTTFFWNVFHYNKKWARYDQTSSHSVKVMSSCTIVSRHYLKNGTFYEKTLLKIKYVFWFSLQRPSEIFFIIIRNERAMIKHPHVV
jgi:hypothetical protein